MLIDVRYAWKAILRDPGHALAVGTVLAVAMAATVAVYSIVAAVLLRPLAFPGEDELVAVRQLEPKDGTLFDGASGPSFRDWQREARTITRLSAYSGPGSSIVGEGVEAERARVTTVTPGFFAALGVSAEAGRLLDESDGEQQERLAVLGHGFWQRRFGGEGRAVGSLLMVDGVRYRIIGVARPGLAFPRDTELWLLLRRDAAYLEVRGAHILGVIGRLAPGQAPVTAQAELDRILEAVPGYTARTRVQRLHDELVGDLRTPLLVLLGAVALVLLIAAANAGNLMLARAETRRRELAIRAAIGAGWRRVAGQILAEGVLLSLLAGLAGVAMAAWLLDVLVALAPVDLPRAAEVRLDARVLGVAFGVAVSTGILTALVPALRALRGSPGAELRDWGSRGGSRSARRSSAVFVVAEVALSVVLLFGAALLLRSFIALSAVDPGFRTSQLTTFEYSLPAYRYPEAWQVREFNRELLARVRALPLTRSAALSRNLPVTRTNMVSPALVEGDARPPETFVQIAQVSDDYFGTLGIPVRSGRAFSDEDRHDARPVAIVDEAFASAYFPGEDPVGRRARTYFGEEMREIVGVVASTVHASLAEVPPPRFYYPEPQMPANGGHLIVRSDAPVPLVLDAVREVARSIDPGLPFGQTATMAELVERTTAGSRFYATVLGTFASLALLLALTGFFAVLSRAVSSRRREIAIRLAVGAPPAGVRRMVVREALTLTAAGLVIGLVAALAGGRTLASLLFHVRPGDPAALAGVTALLVLTALLAAWLPARRAASTDPVRALQAD